MPFASYLTVEDALRNSARLVKEGGADGVKLEGGSRVAWMVQALTDAGIPVIGHVGLTPQTAVQQGGLGMKGNTARMAKDIFDSALALQDAGAVGVVLECVPKEVAALVTSALSIPTIGIGAGPKTSGQVLVSNDLLGFTSTRYQKKPGKKSKGSPFFVHEFAQGGELMQAGIEGYVSAVRAEHFPGPQHATSMPPEEVVKLQSLLGMASSPATLPQHDAISPKSTISSAIDRVLVVGAGAMGCTLAAALDAAGTAVSVATRWEERKDCLARDGLTLEGVGGKLPRQLCILESFNPSVDLLSPMRGSFDCVIVATKAPCVAEVAQFAKSALKQDGILLGVQNGSGSLLAFEGLSEAQSVDGAVTSLGARSTSSSCVRHTVVAGDSPNYFRILSKSPKASTLRDSLEQGFASLAGADGAVCVELVTQPIQALQSVWEKLAVNAVLNPICALFDVPNGALREDRFAEIRRGIAAEVDAVAAASGIVIPGGAEAAALAVAESTAENICSMLVDVQRGLKTEVDFINGFIIREAEKLGLQMPINRQIQAMVHALHRPKLNQIEAPPVTPVVSTIQEMRNIRRGLTGKVGFVPTMGGLHEGHLSLIHAARARGCDHVVVSIFVNGSQFAAHEDFDKYPRNHDKDLKTLREKAPVDAVFAPLAHEIYPHDPRGLNLRTRIEPIDILSEPEALSRPHFFGGVATICASLFNIVQPDVVVFGQKDALQCTVIQNLVEDLHMPIDVVVVDTEREASGLAQSTRNKYLSQELFDKSPIVLAALRKGADCMQRGGSLEESKSVIHQMFADEPFISEIQYVAIADRRSGREIEDLGSLPEGAEATISCAIKMKHNDVEVRLIDNVCVKL
jgi:pantoate--beta-alanine ligase